jgi:hypothetical protein
VVRENEMNNQPSVSVPTACSSNSSGLRETRDSRFQSAPIDEVLAVKCAFPKVTF